MVQDNLGVTRGRVNHISQRGRTGCKRARGRGHQRRGKGQGITVHARVTQRQRGMVQDNVVVTRGGVCHIRGGIGQRLLQHNRRGNTGNIQTLARIRLKPDKPLCWNHYETPLNKASSRKTGKVCYSQDRQCS